MRDYRSATVETADPVSKPLQAPQKISLSLMILAPCDGRGVDTGVFEGKKWQTRIFTQNWND
jgi:hypothetical protein